MITKNHRFALLTAVAAVLLSIPFIAMQFTEEVNWDGFDFIVGGGLLFGTAFMIELTLRRFKSLQQRLIICGIILLILFLVWAELAVGVFGTPFAGS